jgi:hypothetical protein
MACFENLLLTDDILPAHLLPIGVLSHNFDAGVTFSGNYAEI